MSMLLENIPKKEMVLEHIRRIAFHGYRMGVISFEWVRSERSFDYVIRGLFECTGKIHHGKKYIVCVEGTRCDYICKTVWHHFLIDQINAMWGKGKRNG